MQRQAGAIELLDGPLDVARLAGNLDDLARFNRHGGELSWQLLGSLEAGDRLVVSELSRLGRSLGQVIQLVDELVKRKVRFTAIKEAIRFEGKQDMQTKVMIALFGLFAEVERDLISERTKEGLAAARAKGRLLGRPLARRDLGLDEAVDGEPLLPGVVQDGELLVGQVLGAGRDAQVGDGFRCCGRGEPRGHGGPDRPRPGEGMLHGVNGCRNRMRNPCRYRRRFAKKESSVVS